MADDADAAGTTSSTETVALLRRRIDTLEQAVEDSRNRLRIACFGAVGIAAAAALGVYLSNAPAREAAALEASAAALAERTPALAGYPIAVVADLDAKTLTAKGLAPSDTARAELAETLGKFAKDEGLTLRLMTPTPGGGANAQAQDVWRAIEPEIAQALAPVSAAASDAAIRVQDLEDALAGARDAIVAQQATLDGLNAAIETGANDRAAILTDLDARLGALDEEDRILSAEIKAGERFAERRRLRLTDRLEADIAGLRNDVAEARTAVAAAAGRQEDVQGMLKARLTGATDDLEKSIADLAATLASNGARTAVLNQSIAGLSETLEAQIADLAALKSSVSDAAAEASTGLQALNAATATNAASIEAAATVRATHAATLDKLAESAGIADARIKELSVASSERSAKMDALAEADANLARNTSAVLGDLAAETEALRDQTATASTRADAAAETATAAAATAQRLETAVADLAALRGDVAQLSAALDRQANQSAAAQANLAAWQGQLESSSADASKLTPQDSDAVDRPVRTPGAVAATAAIQERVNALEARAGEAIALLDQRIDRLAKAAEPRAPSEVAAARQQLTGVRIQFASAARPANAQDANATLRKIGEIALGLPEDARIRVIGYADSDGTTEANRITSKRRSDWAVEELAKIGVPRGRLISVGRGAERLLSPDANDDSPNRRVEFELFTPSDDG